MPAKEVVAVDLSPICPSCGEQLRSCHDLWGEYYVCEHCGFATAEDIDLVLAMGRARPWAARFPALRGHSRLS